MNTKELDIKWGDYQTIKKGRLIETTLFYKIGRKKQQLSLTHILEPIPEYRMKEKVLYQLSKDNG